MRHWDSFRAQGRRPIVWISVTWPALCVLAFVVTYISLQHDDFDGLNNMFQVPLALPWFFLGGSSSHEVNAWVDLGFGLLNVAIFDAVWLYRSRRRSAPDRATISE